MRLVKMMWILPGLLLVNTAMAGMQEIRSSNNQLGFQTMTLNVDYAERDNYGVLLDTESGPVPGIALNFSSMSGKSDLYFQAQFSRNAGRTKYIGGYISPPTPYGSVVTTSAAIFTNFSARLGQGLELGRSTAHGSAYMLTPYIELGRQIWYRGVNLGETYYHNSFGAGLLWQMSPAGSDLVISVNGLLGNTFGAYIDITGYFAGPLGSSPLYKAGLNFDYALSRELHVNAGVDYVSFAYGRSAVYSGYYEPDSTSTYLLYKAGLGIAF